jgi:hypothetical protein
VKISTLLDLTAAKRTLLDDASAQPADQARARP